MTLCVYAACSPPAPAVAVVRIRAAGQPAIPTGRVLFRGETLASWPICASCLEQLTPPWIGAGALRAAMDPKP